jgi:hypothetical protein
MKTAIFMTLAALAVAAPASEANAQIYSGVVTGTLRFYQNQGNYCPTTRDCSGAQYLESEYHTYQPVRDVKVYVETSAGSLIGSGSTDENGDFTITWIQLWSYTSAARVYFTGAHKDNRFRFQTPSGGTHKYQTSNFTLTNGGTLDIGTRNWGSSSDPKEMVNAYDGAVSMWKNSLEKSNRMKNNFNDVVIYAFSDTEPNSCGTSCASGTRNDIQLDDDAAYKPQARVMHEMGHIASYVASPRSRPSNNYCYPNDTGSGCTWSFTTAEWRSSSFEEGLATFISDSAFYYWWANDPRTCNSTGACSGTSSEIETSKGSSSNCATDEGRWALTTIRYLWDIYDGVDDPDFSDTVRRERYEVIDTLAAFPSGFDDHEKNEPFDSSWTVDNRDGHSGYDFYYNQKYNHSAGIDSYTLRQNNCYP